MNKQLGFTLIELMIVVAIISILLALAVPNLLRSRMSANEASAVSSLRTLNTGEVSYQASGISIDPTTGVGQYGDLTALGAGLVPFIDSSLSAGTKNGYTFAVAPTINPVVPTFTATAQPAGTSTGIKTYFVDESGVIRFQGDGTAADLNSLPLN